MEVHFSIKSFNELSVYDLYTYLQLRSEVFVVEQNCIYQDLDNQDQNAFHVFIHKESTLVACARIITANDKYPMISIGRVIVAKTFRNQQFGHILMKNTITAIEKQFGTQQIVLSAQAHLQNFYKKHNFAPQGEIYLEDGIPHIQMIRK